MRDHLDKLRLAVGFLLLLIPYVLYSFYSFAFVDRNLLLNSSEPFWRFQTWIWQFGFEQREMATVLVIGIVTATLISYLGALKYLSAKHKRWYLGAVVLLLTFSYPPFSHDLFNYIFNARMVVEHQANPHISTALEFPEDDWTRFMHNTHTAAPYGYGWTAITTPLYLVGVGKFLPTYLVFKIFAAGSFLAMIYALSRFLRAVKLPATGAWLVALHPLMLIELVGNAHNDATMIALALVALLMMLSNKRSLGLLSLFLSISIKYVTVLLFPLMIFWKQIRSHKVLGRVWVELVVIGFLLPLLLPRSQWFHPWYLSWAFVFLPAVKSRALQAVLVGLSVSSVFRYAPYFWIGQFTPAVVQAQLLITWLGGITVACIWYTMKR